MFIEFILDVDARHLASRTLVDQRFSRRKKRAFVVYQRIERSLDLQEDVVLR